MKNIVIAILVFFAFFWISVVSAGDGHGKRGNWPVKESPESIVTCADAGTHLVLSRSVPGTINLEQCKVWEPDVSPDPCAPCITSLEEQGCKIVDVGVSGLSGQANVAVTYLLSCDGR